MTKKNTLKLRKRTTKFNSYSDVVSAMTEADVAEGEVIVGYYEEDGQDHAVLGIGGLSGGTKAFFTEGKQGPQGPQGVPGIYDISEAHASGGVLAKYADLATALGTNGANIPEAFRKGGMSVKFVQSSDNKYVQYRLTTEAFSTTPSDWQGVDEEITPGSKNLAESGAVATAIENAIEDTNILQRENDALYVCDSDGNVVAKIDQNGVHATDFTDKNGTKLSDTTSFFAVLLAKYYKKEFYISDSSGNVIFKVGANGIKTTGIEADHANILNLQQNDWRNKNLATYGDSVTAVNNGDFSYPYNFTEGVKYRWGNRVAQYFGMSNHYGRGIGGTKYVWGSHGGSLCLVETSTGIAKNRYDNYTYDDYLADPTIITVPSGQTPIRGCGCSWLRITTMFPESIKDGVDIVTIMFHNDAADNMDATFVDNSVVDLEWSQSDYYADYGGDYNIETFRGAMASLIMKMQAWMPNAVLVLMSPISGQGTANRFKAYFNTLPQVSVGDVYSPNNGAIRMTVTAITDTEDEKSITFATFEYACNLPVGATSLIKKSGASGSTSTLTFTSLSDKNLDGTLIDINLQLPDTGLYNQISIVDTMSQKLSIPFINIFHNCGINGFNKRFFIADTIHPYSEDGSKMIARAIVGGMKNIIPYNSMNF